MGRARGVWFPHIISKVCNNFKVCFTDNAVLLSEHLLVSEWEFRNHTNILHQKWNKLKVIFAFCTLQNLPWHEQTQEASSPMLPQDYGRTLLLRGCSITKCISRTTKIEYWRTSLSQLHVKPGPLRAGLLQNWSEMLLRTDICHSGLPVSGKITGIGEGLKEGPGIHPPDHVYFQSAMEA